MWNATYADPIGMTKPYLQKGFSNKKGVLGVCSWVTTMLPWGYSWNLSLFILFLIGGRRRWKKRKMIAWEVRHLFACALPKNIECWCRQMDRSQHRMRIFLGRHHTQFQLNLFTLSTTVSQFFPTDTTVYMLITIHKIYMLPSK